MIVVRPWPSRSLSVSVPSTLHRHAWHMSRPSIQIKDDGLVFLQEIYLTQQYMGMGAEWKRCPVARVVDHDHKWRVGVGVPGERWGCTPPGSDRSNQLHSAW